MKQYFYLAGLPRTGSTVLGEILNQNKNIHVSTNSPLSEIISEIIIKWEIGTPSLRAYKYPKQLSNIWRGVRDGMYAHRRETYIIDKSRGWHKNEAIDTTRLHLNEEMKIICTVDTITDCLASFIVLLQKAPEHVSFIDQYLNKWGMEINNTNRCIAMMDPKMPTSLGSCYHNLKATYEGPNKNNILLIERKNLVQFPKVILNKIYTFLNIPVSIEHDFNNIKKEIIENDTKAYGIPNLHKVDLKLHTRKYNAREILGEELFLKYSELEFWR